MFVWLFCGGLGEQQVSVLCQPLCSGHFWWCTCGVTIPSCTFEALIHWRYCQADAVPDWSRGQSSRALCFHLRLFFLFHPLRKQGFCRCVCKAAAFCWQPSQTAFERAAAGLGGGRELPELLGLWLLAASRWWGSGKMWLQGGNEEDSVCLCLCFQALISTKAQALLLLLSHTLCVCEAKLRGAEAAVQAAWQHCVHSFGHLCLGGQALLSALPHGHPQGPTIYTAGPASPCPLLSPAQPGCLRPLHFLPSSFWGHFPQPRCFSCEVEQHPLFCLFKPIPFLSWAYKYSCLIHD